MALKAEKRKRKQANQAARIQKALSRPLEDMISAQHSSYSSAISKSVKGLARIKTDDLKSDRSSV